MLLFTCDLIVYIENLEDSMDSLLKLIREFNKILGVKLTYKSQLFFYNYVKIRRKCN